MWEVHTTRVGTAYNPHLLDPDLDDPGPSQYEHINTLEYNELPDQPPDDPFVEPSSLGPICGALENSIKAAETRAKEAFNLFGNIASYLDDQWAAPSRASLPAKQRAALKDLCVDLAAVASRHFDAYINEIPVSKADTCTNPAPHRPTRNSEPASYANIARKGPNNCTPNSLLSRNKGPACSGLQSRPQPQRHRTDDRLFVRIPEGDKLRDLSAYAIQSHLKAKLGTDGRLLTNVQSTKTGFALCPKDGDTAKLKETISKVNFFGDAQVEPASPWTSYRIKNVPRTFGTINDKLVYCLQPVTAAAMHDALSAAAGVAPVNLTNVFPISFTFSDAEPSQESSLDNTHLCSALSAGSGTTLAPAPPLLDAACVAPAYTQKTNTVTYAKLRQAIPAPRVASIATAHTLRTTTAVN
ncbi:hypothetical protein K3495_g13836 [Podosphaera aphanis]|nr:hypothetical protein K3495_g13836 [Podosphaera aphanis]